MTTEWSQKIQLFVQKHSEHLHSLGPAKMIHADLNHEHLMLEEVNGNWQVTGLLDFVDSMNAPVELKFIQPVLFFSNVITNYKNYSGSRLNNSRNVKQNNIQTL